MITHELTLVPDKFFPRLFMWRCSCNAEGGGYASEKLTRKWHAEHVAQAGGDGDIMRAVAKADTKARIELREYLTSPEGRADLCAIVNEAEAADDTPSGYGDMVYLRSLVDFSRSLLAAVTDVYVAPVPEGEQKAAHARLGLAHQNLERLLAANGDLP